MITIEYIKEEPKDIHVFGIGNMRKGLKVICSKEMAESLKDDTRFEVKGLKADKKEAKNG